MQRKTRSGRAFGCWETANDVNLAALLREAVAQDDLRHQLDESAGAELRGEPGSDLTSGLDAEALTQGSALSPAPSASDAATAERERRAATNALRAAIPAHVTGKARKAMRDKLKGHALAQKRRATARADPYSHHTAQPQVTKKFAKPDNATPSDVGVTEAKVASTAYIALNDPVRDTAAYTLEDLVGPDSKHSFRLVEYRKGVSFPIISSDKEEYVVAVFADTPNDSQWPELAAAAAKHLEEARHRCSFGEDNLLHRRGEFAVLKCGVSHGGGRTHPGEVSNSKGNARVAAELNAKEPFQRLAGFATAVMATWAPRMHTYYKDRLGKFHQRYRHLPRNFPRTGSVFEATSYNLGPRTVSYRHLDFANLPYGWCAITALGEFDYTRGGHLILWDAKLVLEFPPGTTILLPSALISHSNTTIASHKRRYSFTQYTAGALFRWVENGFQRSVDLMAQLKKDPAALARHKVAESGRWKFGLSLMSRLEELQEKPPSSSSSS